MVEKGALIAELADPEKEIQFIAAEEKFKSLQAGLESLKEEISRESEAIKEATNREIASKEYAVEQLKNDIKSTIATNQTKKKLADQGLISQVELDKAEEGLIAKRIELETISASIASLKAKLVQGLSDRRVEKQRTTSNPRIRRKECITSLYSKSKSAYLFTGKVLDWLVNLGDLIGPGTPLVWMEHSGGDKPISHAVLGFLPIEKGKKIKVGDRVEIELTTVNTSQYGYLEGVIKTGFQLC